ncbi:MAG: Cof-type HAD-IIB family hydrolase [Lachnospiraceae bacterium]|jgi:Cof subfamily protein (haloacid dehalogenase superfamily)|nr:Cof-type HAD-IIB family hydrolase [Lachnospiraceae bacterium]
MIKLIASDIDGTLLVEGSDALNPEIFQVIRGLKEKDVIFAAASGRQYASIRHLFDPVANDMIFIADNGSNIICRGYEMHASLMEREVLCELVEEVRGMADCYLVLSSRQGESYLESYTEELMELLVNGYHNKVNLVEDLLKEPVEYIKCSIYKKENIRQLAHGLIEKYRDRLNVAVAGEIWLDFMDRDADKGNAIRTIQKSLRIRPEETMVFGDNMNDIGMMRAAGESYAVANAQQAVKEAAKHIAQANIHDGVLKVMKKVLDEQ